MPDAALLRDLDDSDVWVAGCESAEIVGVVLADDTVVSMNLWGLQPQVFDALRDGWAAFHGAHADDPKAEFLLRTVIGSLVDASEASVAVHSTASTWVGVTYPGDLDEARATIAALTTAGTYPSTLRAD